MKASFLIPAAAVVTCIFATVPATYAADSSAKPENAQPSGTMGTTAWTEGRRDRQGGRSAGSADQPEMATGEDLKGPPIRFAPDDTPE
jgi:hypothetical protein